jgi:hypothetical protein
MNARQCLQEAHAAGPDFQRPINVFVDDFRRADAKLRSQLVSESIGTKPGKLEGLIAAIVSALCRESGVETPNWAGTTGSPEPFFVIPAKSFELRLRLMIESPPPFRCRNVFVPENYLSRA